MPNMDTSVAIQQAIINQDSHNPLSIIAIQQAINLATQGHKA